MSVEVSYLHSCLNSDDFLKHAIYQSAMRGVSEKQSH